MSQKTAVIVGAGPAGLTAARELLRQTQIRPVVFERSASVGGLSRTINYKGNRIDIGGHRFFSKSPKVMDWWQQILPVQRMPASEAMASQAVSFGAPDGPDPERTDNVMLVRDRLSRILFMGRLFDYPLSPNPSTLWHLGLLRTFRIAMSYAVSRFRRIYPEESLEDFLVNRFGHELYRTFFRDYTEKVWGVPCTEISAEWGSQRIKGLSMTKVVADALRGLAPRGRGVEDRKTETSLIRRFLYPKYGPGQLWQETAATVTSQGGEIRLLDGVVGVRHNGTHVTEVTVQDGRTGATRHVKADYLLSTMPVADLIRALGDGVPQTVREIAAGLPYRDFITVGLLLSKPDPDDSRLVNGQNGIIADNWVYVQEKQVKLGRVQIFNNWSPYMVKDPTTVWLGLEYFCSEGDALWSRTDRDMIRLAIDELELIRIARGSQVLDAVVVREPKAYPAYFGTYPDFSALRDYLDTFDNLFLMGRNGMHRYNNQDHSMLTAMTAAANIAEGRSDKANIWEVNAERQYHESGDPS